MTERRRNALSGEWVLVSPARLLRPWGGEVSTPPDPAVAWSPDCFLCPRNVRAGGVKNPGYSGVFVFDNDYPALNAPAEDWSDGLLRREGVGGRCRVVCYSERHDLSLGGLSPDGIERVVETWRGETFDLGRRHAWVQVFENRGAMMGASSVHPHGQVWATTHVPTEVEREDAFQREHHAADGVSLLLAYVEQETKRAERVVLTTEHWVVVVPYWAAWPYETLLIPIAPASSLTALDDAQASDLAIALEALLSAYDSLFGVPFPYSMGWHGTPSPGVPHWQLHAHFYPPLLRSATVRKHMVGFELLAEAQRDFAPEEAAVRLRAAVHGLKRPGP